jgi:hypothetical protein
MEDTEDRLGVTMQLLHRQAVSIESMLAACTYTVQKKNKEEGVQAHIRTP